ncbi:hypothetical protein H4S02_002763 [Coemansia sp. RSA 2611]|nr:hypothetical protein LPJ60_002779 [Coemansia sp. RSA 2675]KAJ2388650.1 hypothetical protein H4S02_002763 [Coemansia sp. RSA 2611]KAJ2703837.1 hypothetical protein H4218_000076 [Coemansia sp. IMI 209128]
MNSEFSTPSRSQQHSPSLCSQQLAPVGILLPVTPTSAVDINNPHFAYLKGAYPTRPFSPSMDFANMNIASGYPTPHSATPVATQPQPQIQLQQPPMPLLEQLENQQQPDASDSTAAALSPLADEKPEYSYASLIAQSLIDAPTQRRTLNGIYEWIQKNFPYYRSRQNWQNSIRHNLSLNKGFMKMKRDEAHPGKGSFWTFTPGYETCLNAGHFKPIRSRSGRAALAAAAAMAVAIPASTEGSAEGRGSDNEMANSPNCQVAALVDAGELTIGASPDAKKVDKKVSRTVKAAKSLKRSHSVPPKEPRNPMAASSSSAAPPSHLSAGSSGLAPPSPSPLVHSDTLPVGSRKSAKKMRVSSSQGHMGLVSVITQPGMLSGSGIMSHSQSPFAPSPVYHHHHHQSPAMICATPMSLVNTAVHTPLHPPAQFQFQMQPSCSVPMPMSAMDLASVPATNGPYMGSFVGPFGEPVASMDGTGYFGDNGNGSSSSSDMMYGPRRTNAASRISWHGTESMAQAFTNLQQQHSGFHMQHQNHQLHQAQPLRQASSLGVAMGSSEHGDVTFSMLGEGHSMAMGTDSSINHSPVDWTMFAGISAPPVPDFPLHTPQLHHVSSVSSIDIHHSNGSSNNHHHHAHSHSIGQSRVANMSMDIAASGAMVATGGEGSNNQGIITFYDEMLRDPSSLVNVFNQDFSGWQCPAKTNTIDPAALCAVDPETNNTL